MTKVTIDLDFARGKFPLSWWDERVEIEKTLNDGSYMAVCPSHRDDKPSLHLTVGTDDLVVAHCFADCDIREILMAADSRQEIDVEPMIVTSSNGNGNGHVFVPDGEALDVWAEYTQVPREEWESLGCRNEGYKVAFRFQRPDGTWAAFYKLRELGPDGQKGLWVGDKKPSSSILWPSPVSETSKEVWLFEGESDTGVMRHLGFPAYTFGGVSNAGDDAADVLRAWGFEKAVICFDADKAGRKGAEDLLESLDSARFVVEIVSLESLVDRRIQEKDVRDLFKRHSENLSNLIREQCTNSPVPWERLDEHVSQASETIPWLIEPYIALNALTLVIADAKAGKTTFTFSAAHEMRPSRVQGLNRVFLNTKGVVPGNILYLSEDGRDQLKVKTTKHLLFDEMQHIHVIPKWKISEEFPTWPERVQLIKRFLRLHPETKLVVIDTLQALAEIEDENNASVVNKALGRLRDLAQQEGVAVLALHYLNKQGGYRGSTAFMAVPDVIVEIDVDVNEIRHLKLKTKQGEAPEPLAYNVDATVTPVRLKVSDDRPENDPILDCFEGNEVLSIRDILERQGFTSAESLHPKSPETQALRRKIKNLLFKRKLAQVDSTPVATYRRIDIITTTFTNKADR